MSPCERRARAITTSRVLEVIRLVDRALRQMHLPRRRLAVGGLNPHAGEAGLFGDEEIREIAPAIAQAQAEGLDASGPWPPDTIFARQRAGEFEAVVAMLHDHGHIAVKTLGFTRGRDGRMHAAGVNVTLGLPIIRTSVDHGTAFDIAGPRGRGRGEYGGGDPAGGKHDVGATRGRAAPIVYSGRLIPISRSFARISS